MPTIDATVNFAKVTVPIGYDAAAVSIVLSGGGGAMLPPAPFNATWWNATDYGDPSDDPQREIIRIVTKAVDVLSILRAQEGTAASSKNTAGKVYKLVAGITSKLIQDMIQNLSFAVGPMSVPMQNVKFPAASNLALPVGTTDLYTVPAGRKALVIDTVCTLVGAGAWTIYHQVKVGGVYFRYGVAVSAQAAVNGLSTSAPPMVMNAGESYAVNNNQTGTSTSIWPYIIEFDDTAPIFRASLGAFAAGANLVFTVPALTSVSFYGTPSGFALPFAGVLLYFNNTGAARTVSWNIVPSAGAPAAANQIQSPSLVADNTLANQVFWGGMAPGDTVSINSDASTAGQMAWVNYVRMAA